MFASEKKTKPIIFMIAPEEFRRPLYYVVVVVVVV